MKITNNPSMNFTSASIPSKIGKTISNSNGAQKVAKLFDPKGGDNTFFGLASIMIGAVLIPRINSALKRNPDNKEATNDEIMEILFRDVQTILIMLFGLKSLNSVIGNISTKLSGIPVVNKPFNKFFNENATTIKEKALDVVQHPIEKLRTIGTYLLDTLNPLGGSKLLNGDDINKKYTNYNSVADIRKLIEQVPEEGGRATTVFAKIKDSIIKGYDNKIANIKSTSVRNKVTGEFSQEAQNKIKAIEEAKEYFTNELTLEKFMDSNTEIPEGYQQEFVDFFADKNNALAKSTRRVNDWLRTLALGIEVAYLGFGLPALNQKRLEKKYLGEKPIGTQQGDTFCPINDKHIKAQEIQLFGNFMK